MRTSSKQMESAISFIFLLALITCQTVNDPKTIQQVNVGKWLTTWDSKESSFPRYLICGAQINYLKRTSPYTCSQTKLSHQPIRTDCVGGKPVWERANGIKFKYCNFQDWDDQKSNQYYGSWQWTGMKMCPKNQFVYGYMTRINEVDGLNGLILMCRNKFTNEQSNITVREGKGTIIGPDPVRAQDNQFAYDFSIKYQYEYLSSYITGLNLIYTNFPEITNVEIQYDSLPAHQIKAEYQPKDIKIQNMKEQDLIYYYDFDRVVSSFLQARQTNPHIKDKTFTYTLTNFRGKYHGQVFNKFFKPGFTLNLLMPKIISKIQEIMDIDRNVLFKMTNLTSDFEFNKAFPQNPHKYDPLQYVVPKCNRLEITSTLYVSTVSNPYTLIVTYTSGSANYVENIRGIYNGILFGRPQVNGNYYYIC